MVTTVRKKRKKSSAPAARAKSTRSLEADNQLLRRKLRDLRKTTRAVVAELHRSLDYQEAIGNILGVISRSHSDVRPIFEIIVEAAHRLCKSEHAFIFQLDGDKYRLAAARDASPAQIKRLQENPIAPGRGSITGRVALERCAIQVDDVLDDPEYTLNVTGVRTTLGVPLLRDGVSIGIIVLTRAVVEPFTPEQIRLVSTFATQALIAIENARLFDEAQASVLRLGRTVEELCALGEVTHAINSTVDLESVLTTIISNATKIAGTDAGAIYMFDSSKEEFWLRATYGVSDEVLAAIKDRRVSKHNKMGEALERRIAIQFSDIEGQTAAPELDVIVRAGYTALLVVPLLDSDNPVGALVLRRKRSGGFPERTIDVMRTFAAQSVLAIRNARLFNETQEALERQTATADVLKVISRSAFNLDSVMNTLTNSAAELCKAEVSALYLREGDVLVARGVAHADAAQVDFLRRTPLQIDDLTYIGRTFQAGAVRNIADVATETEIGQLKRFGEILGFRSIVFVPLMRESRSIGIFALARARTGQFSQREVELVQTFADQAVIAVENVRLFDEVQAKTRDLTESLEQQTATSEVLEVISASPGELEPVFRKMLENACRVCEANFGMMQLWNGGTFNTAAAYNVPPAFAALREGKPIRIHHPQSGLSNVLETHRVVHIHDVIKGAAYLGGDPNVVQLAKIGGARTVVLVPMLKEDEFIGTFTIYRQEVRPFTDKQIALVENFTKQAVIAIENTRLLRELRERTDDLTNSLDDLRAAQDRLVQTEKLASLGQLTAGIAHEIKNPLNFVNNFSSLSAELTEELNDLLKGATLTDKLRKEVEDLTRLLHDNLEKVVQHGKRADSIVKNMLLHSREGSGERRSANINSLVDESLNLAYHGARAEKAGFNITLQRDFDANAGSAELFPQEITRALLNLISNGFYAATKRGNEDGQTEFEPTLRATTKSLGGSVEIRIRDNGAGITPEVKQKMFNPFFTTKPAGEGTGLGLSMTHDIVVKQHGGRIDVATEPGQFTEFTIVLPRSGARQ
jgi:GAF domain-containing protein/anti-sigma regulatory factor (Ser/Thr protein kinase)